MKMITIIVLQFLKISLLLSLIILGLMYYLLMDGLMVKKLINQTLQQHLELLSIHIAKAKMVLIQVLFQLTLVHTM